MTIDVSELSEIEQDAIAEIANMGVSRAASSLRQMVGEQVLLSVPAVKIVTRETASKFVGGGNPTKLVAVQQSFDGPFAGSALLIFPAAQSLELLADIRKIRPSMPVAVVSANLQDEIIGRARELNAGFVAKPLTDDALGAFLSGAALRLKKATS